MRSYTAVGWSALTCMAHYETAVQVKLQGIPASSMDQTWDPSIGNPLRQHWANCNCWLVYARCVFIGLRITTSSFEGIVSSWRLVKSVQIPIQCSFQNSIRANFFKTFIMMLVVQIACLIILSKVSLLKTWMSILPDTAPSCLRNALKARWILSRL